MSYQQITLLGNIGNEPELRYTDSGVPVLGFSLAVNRSWTDKNGQKQEKTLWFKVSAWRKLAEVMGEYVKKGRQVLVVGELEEPRQYKDRDGEIRVSLDVTANTIRLVGPRVDDGESAPAKSTARSTFDEDAPF